MSEEAAVLTEVRGRVLLITLNRPDQMNAVNNALADGLVAAVEELDNNPDLTAGVLTGAGRGSAQAWISRHFLLKAHLRRSTFSCRRALRSH